MNNTIFQIASTTGVTTDSLVALRTAYALPASHDPSTYYEWDIRQCWNRFEILTSYGFPDFLANVLGGVMQFWCMFFLNFVITGERRALAHLGVLPTIPASEIESTVDATYRDYQQKAFLARKDGWPGSGSQFFHNMDDTSDSSRLVPILGHDSTWAVVGLIFLYAILKLYWCRLPARTAYEEMQDGIDEIIARHGDDLSEIAARASLFTKGQRTVYRKTRLPGEAPLPPNPPDWMIEEEFRKFEGTVDDRNNLFTADGMAPPGTYVAGGPLYIDGVGISRRSIGKLPMEIIEEIYSEIGSVADDAAHKLIVQRNASNILSKNNSLRHSDRAYIMELVIRCYWLYNPREALRSSPALLYQEKVARCRRAAIEEISHITGMGLPPREHIK